MVTPRLRLRAIDEGDLDELVRLNADPLVLRFTGNGPLTREEAAAVLAERIRPQYAIGVGRLAVERRADGRFLGWCGLRREDDDPNAYDLGFRLHIEARGFGYATEAALAVLADGRARLAGARIFARVHPENLPSQRVLEKCGLRKVGEADEDGWRWWIYR